MPQPLDRYRSWSRLPLGEPAAAVRPGSTDEVELPGDRTLLPFAQGRTYSDTCVNPGGVVLDTGRLDRILELDEDAGTLRCEAGATLEAILDHVVGRGWFLPVCPGAMRVSVGGAIAHDVHGKNQRSAGTFGCHVRSLELLRSDGARLECSPEENRELFAATIGGLGLTGLVLSAVLQLQRVPSPWFETESVRCRGLEDMLAVLGEASELDYAVAWVDGFGRTPAARAVVVRGRHASGPAPRLPRARARRRPRVLPGVPPWLFRRGTVRWFNRAYYLSHLRERTRRTQHYETFLFPGESVQPTNRHYGTRGVYAYQCLLPTDTAEAGLRSILERTSRPGDQSVSTAVKCFGERRSPGMLSFSGPGLSVVVGFPNEGARTLALMAELDAIVAEAGGKLYPAKDARCPAAMFQRGYPRWREFAALVDPAFGSSFWKRVSGAA